MKTIIQRMKLSIALVVSISCLCACAEILDMQVLPPPSETKEASNTVPKQELDINDLKVRDRKELYTEDVDTKVRTMYLTVKKGNPSDGTDHTWGEVNTYSAYYYQDLKIPRYKVAGILKVGDENGPLPGEFGFDETASNVTVTIRGQTSTRNAQKNYRISIKENKGMYKEQKVINLNKHMGDGLRFRNKLAYDLLEEIPQLMSARTSFVHLYVKDETTGEDGPYVDYGLFTQVEQINKRYLRNHGLDSHGHLYKINFFEYHDNTDVIVNEDDPNYVQEDFETLVESKGNNDHTKLINLIKKINDNTISGEDLLETYVDEENVAYWMAFMILMGNKDTQNRNAFIYSPYSSIRWYYIPWDNDASISDTENTILDWNFGKGWEKGIANYWGNMLFRKLLKSERFRKSLDDAVNDLRNNYINSDNVMRKVYGYAEITRKYLSQMPDIAHHNISLEEFDYLISEIPTELTLYYNEYKESLNKPMPFFIGTPLIEDGRIRLNWENSYDLQNRDITYDVYISNSLDFDSAFFKKTNVISPTVTLDTLPMGQYFIKIIARNSDNLEQYAFDYYMVDNDKVYGVKSFYVNADGSISEEVYVE